MMVFGYLVNLVLPADIRQYGGIRTMNYPVMILFYLSPFIIAFAVAIIFDLVKGCLDGTRGRKG